MPLRAAFPARAGQDRRSGTEALCPAGPAFRGPSGGAPAGLAPQSLLRASPGLVPSTRDVSALAKPA